MKKVIIIYCLICMSTMCMFVFSCTYKNDKHCEALYEKALNNWFQYSWTKDSSYLLRSKQYIDSINCKPVKMKVFELNISLMYSLKDYEKGKEYIESFDSTYFAISYKKEMYLKAFDMAILVAEGDTVGQKQLCKELVEKIEFYLKENPNEESLCDLFRAKVNIESRDNILREIEYIRSLNIYEDKIIDFLIQAMSTDDTEEEVTNVLKKGNEG
ncbi:hypothetical protein [Bacteroides salyersiae]|uniref:hypothetical protein n=1 Tax=Bacteroides salyersiae TaxID=291644 RepID=UPI0021AB5C99|nr:hypothetical protein [Bacteroides salyersiae]